MGRPYRKELSELSSTIEWAMSYPIEQIVDTVRALAAYPLIVVGSGGSTSAANLVARLHQSYARRPVRVTTPLEFVLIPPDEESGVMLLSGGGSNPDILNAVRHAIASEYPVIASVIGRTDSPLARATRECSYAYCVEFTPPTKKDGFLATNSLLATVALLARGYSEVFNVPWDGITFPELSDSVAEDVVVRPLLTVLAAGWSWAAAVDLESKCNEAGLGTVVCTDYRNFAHGRHHGLSRRSADTCVVALISPDCAQVAAATLSTLPADTPLVRLETKRDGATGAIELVLLVFQLVGRIADGAGVDPGRPRVPNYGRQLYHFDFARIQLRQKADLRADRIDYWIRRKVGGAVWAAARESDRAAWRAMYECWSAEQRQADFGGIVFDYDGTVCETQNRRRAPRADVAAAIARLVDHGVIVGVATGRGGSVAEALQEVLAPSCWPRITLGLYNGAIVTSLADPVPAGQSVSEIIQEADKILKTSLLVTSIATTRVSGSKQLTVVAKVPLPPQRLRRTVIEALAGHSVNLEDLSIQESGHSLDVMCRGVSKQSVINEVEQKLSGTQPSSNRKVLAIGDQGSADGNDFVLLARCHSLSVHRVSTSLDKCWNVARPGRRGTQAFLDYLSVAVPMRGDAGFRLDMDALEGSATGV